MDMEYKFYCGEVGGWKKTDREIECLMESSRRENKLQFKGFLL